MSVEYERRPHYASWLVRPARGAAVRAYPPPPAPAHPDRDDIDLRPYACPPPPLSSAGPASEPGGGAAARACDRACFSLLSSVRGVFYSLLTHQCLLINAPLKVSESRGGTPQFRDKSSEGVEVEPLGAIPLEASEQPT